MANGFIQSSLVPYVEEHATELKLKAFYTSKTITLFEKQKGVKGPTTINLLATTTYLQTGGCGWSASGSSTFTQRTITPGSWKVNEPYCPKDLEAYFEQTILPPGQQYEDIPTAISQKIIEGKMGDVGQIVETALWQGDVGSGNSQLNKFNGYVTLLNLASGSTVLQTTSAWTQATSYNIIDAMVLACPAALKTKTDTCIFIGMDKFSQYISKLISLNLYHFDGKATDFEITHPGTNITIIGLNGLNSVGHIYLGQKSNFFIGVDKPLEEMDFSFFYAKEADEVRLIMKGMMGVNVAYPNEIVDQPTV